MGQSSLGLGCPDDGCVHYFLADRGVDHYFGIEMPCIIFTTKTALAAFCVGVFVGVGHGKKVFYDRQVLKWVFAPQQLVTKVRVFWGSLLLGGVCVGCKEGPFYVRPVESINRTAAGRHRNERERKQVNFVPTHPCPVLLTVVCSDALWAVC